MEKSEYNDFKKTFVDCPSKGARSNYGINNSHFRNQSEIIL